jgi:hypothetical protein
LPCWHDRGVECGTVAVPLDHDDAGAGTVDLFTAAVPAAQESGAAPIVLLGGGPGEHLVERLLGTLPQSGLPALAVDRDLGACQVLSVSGAVRCAG